MTGPPAQVTEPGLIRLAGRGIGRAAVVIGSITVLARVVGFGRQLVFAHTVGNHCLGTAYATANQVPNIIYDVVLGGALTSVVVPVLAGAAARRSAGGEAGPGAGPDQQASQIASALLTWTVVLLVPVSLLLIVLARPLASLLLAGVPGCNVAVTESVSSQMLVVFAPQILLYGLAVVLYGILQAHRRFTAPALAPVVSSLVVIAAYIAFLPLAAGAQNHLASLPKPAELVLSVGTTAGVVALVLTALGPAVRLRLRLRPALRFPAGVARRVRGLAAVGVAVLVAQDAALVVVMVLANGHAGHGALVLYTYGWQMFFVPYAVLAVPIATSAFPVLSAGDGDGFDRTAAAATRAVILVSCLGAALLAGAAGPASRLFVSGPGQARQLAFAFAAFAPGLIGYGLAANLSRVLFACQRSRVAAVALVTGWLLVIVTDVAAVPAVPPRWVVPVLAVGNTVGLTIAGLALLAAVRAARGPVALRGAGRAAVAGLTGGLAGAAAGALVSAGLPVTGFARNAAVSALACLAAAVAFTVVAMALDGGDLRAMAGRARARMTRRPA
ncbi:MAG TPA: lipid II flippase MurJ [Streptosporangiaceae bacterium]|nr:lipid II flippase MurJ [Streptosporangiaceae bacterium]